MECHYCRFGGGKHDVACPASMSGDANVRAHKVWRSGYDCGRLGWTKPTDVSATYSLGWLRGEAALEEAQNGEPFSDTADFNDDCRDEITEGEND